jgi:phospholipid/cholesterol/gamma-HCH transport system ATP-binding protein
MSNTQPAIEISHLSTVLGKAQIHRNINLMVREGEILAIIGGSGSGKTTLMREMLGLMPPTTGEIRVLGVDLARLDPAARKLLATRSGVVFQNGALFSALTVFDNVALPVREAHWWPEELLSELVLLTLEQTGIQPQDSAKLPAELSGGMVKRVALARALVLEPELLFLDEPTTGLAPDQKHEVAQLISHLKRELGLTVVMVTHDVDTLIALADRVAVLADQALVTVGPLPEVVHFPHPFVQSFFLKQASRCEQRRIAEFRTGLAQLHPLHPPSLQHASH